MTLNFKYLTFDDESFLTVYVPGEAPLLASNESHGNFDELVRLAQAGDESVVELFDTERAITKAFADVVEGRVAVRGGIVYFDDDAQDNAITEAILRFHEAGEPLGPMVNFMENVMANPQVESREQFFRYLQAYEMPVDDDGCVILYKGVYKGADDAFYSTHAGHAFVNGVEFKNVRVPNRVGDIVTMPRSEVDFDPNSACSTGLHSGTHSYAGSYGDTLMYIRVNPRDVVSVPHDVSSQKVRVCRYEVVGFADRKNAYKGARWVGEKKAEEVKPVEPKLVPLTKANVYVGATVRRAAKPLDRIGQFTTEAESMVDGKDYTVESYDSYDLGFVRLAETKAFGGVWLPELLLVEGANPKAATSGKTDTRLNHTKQLRDSKGHFIKQV